LLGHLNTYADYDADYAGIPQQSHLHVAPYAGGFVPTMGRLWLTKIATTDVYARQFSTWPRQRGSGFSF
jgi:hypothetical protein